MKPSNRIFFQVTAFLLLVSLFSCSEKKPDKTIANLKAAYIEEVSQIDRYYKSALKAKEENFDKIAIMFTALAKSESLQAENFMRILNKLGVTIEAPAVNSEAHSTFENLLLAYRSEFYDSQIADPREIEEAKMENVPDAVEMFSWEKNDDAQHMGYFYVALTAYATKSEITMPDKWYVCPKCAATFAEADVKDPCPFCQTPQSQFLEFK